MKFHGKFLQKFTILHSVELIFFRRIQAKRTYDFLEMYLFCDGEGNGLDQLIKTEVTCNLVSTNGNNFRRTSKLCFEKPGGQGIIKFIKWNDMIESFLNPLEDSLIVEAHVKIFMVEGLCS